MKTYFILNKVTKKNEKEKCNGFKVNVAGFKDVYIFYIQHSKEVVNQAYWKI